MSLLLAELGDFGTLTFKGREVPARKRSRPGGGTAKGGKYNSSSSKKARTQRKRCPRRGMSEAPERTTGKVGEQTVRPRAAAQWKSMLKILGKN